MWSPSSTETSSFTAGDAPAPGSWVMGFSKDALQRLEANS